MRQYGKLASCFKVRKCKIKILNERGWEAYVWK